MFLRILKSKNLQLQYFPSGFTLIELLVVVAVIGILAAVLMPALGRGREQARRVACVNNLHQLGISLGEYATDNYGSYPIEKLCGNPQSALVGGLFPAYLSERDVFYCPSADIVEEYAQSDEYGGPGGDSVINTDENWARSYISYKYFSMIERDTRMPLPLSLSDYPHILSDLSPDARWLMSDWVRSNVPVFPHMEKGGYGGGRNVLFVGSSVRFVRHKTYCAFKDE